MIAIFDYGAGNLRSVQNTLDEIGAPYELVRDAAGLERAPKIILPGVGHFGQMLRALDEMNVRETLIERIKADVPFLGICLGLQCAVIEFARNVCGLAGADSTEFDEERGVKTKHPVVCLLEEQRAVTEKGGTMRLGACPCVLEKGTKAFEAYGEKKISERHRHRYEVNNNYRKQLEEGGLVISGANPDIGVIEMN